MSTTTETSTRPADAVEAARSLGSPAVAGAPDSPEAIPTVEEVDWTGLIIAALGPSTSIDLPLPQLLLRLTETVATLAANAEHLKGFVAGTGQDQEDLAGAMHKRVTKTEKTATNADMAVKKLERRVEQLEAALTAPDDASKVQEPNLSQA